MKRQGVVVRMGGIGSQGNGGPRWITPPSRPSRGAIHYLLQKIPLSNAFCWFFALESVKYVLHGTL